MIPGASQAALVRSAEFFVHLAVVLVPLFVGASFLVGLAQEYLPPERVERLLREHDEGTGNVAAAGVGAVTPFCSCSTVPMLAGLLQAGAPLGLAFSFLLASPLVNEIALLLLVGLFGLEVAALYAVVTFTAAIAGGLIIGRLGLESHLKDIQPSSGQAVTDGGTVSCCTPTVERVTHRERISAAGRESLSFFHETIPYLLLGMTIGALIHGIVPSDWLTGIFGAENPFAVPIAAVAGAPIYVSLSAMLPVASALAEQGIPIGTVLAFVVGSAGVSIPNLVLLNKLFDRTLLAVYVSTVVTIGVVVGLLFNAVAI